MDEFFNLLHLADSPNCLQFDQAAHFSTQCKFMQAKNGRLYLRRGKMAAVFFPAEQP
jgi:hypothetical protein